MGLNQLLRRLWHLKYFALCSAAVCAIAAIVTVYYIPERYIASAPVQLETTFEANAQQYVVDSKQIDAFVKSQAEMAKHINVTGTVVDRLRWAESYQLAQEFRRSGADADKDLRTWLGDSLADRIVLNFTEGSPSFTLSYVGLSPDEAQTMASLLRDAYIENSARSGRVFAEDQEARLDRQLDRLRERMQSLEERNIEFGRRNDVVLNADGVSLTEVQLRNAAAAPLPLHRPPPPVIEGSSKLQKDLNDLDAEIARLSVTLGPNHPRLLRLQTQRQELAQEIPEQSAPATTRERPSLEDVQRQREQEYLSKADAISTAKRYDAELKSLERRFSALSEQRQNFALDSALQRPTASSGGAVALEDGVYYPRATFAIAGAAAFGALLALLIGLLSSLLQLRVQSDRDLQGLGLKVLGRREGGARSSASASDDLAPLVA